MKKKKDNGHLISIGDLSPKAPVCLWVRSTLPATQEAHAHALAEIIKYRYCAQAGIVLDKHGFKTNISDVDIYKGPHEIDPAECPQAYHAQEVLIHARRIEHWIRAADALNAALSAIQAEQHLQGTWPQSVADNSKRGARSVSGGRKGGSAPKEKDCIPKAEVISLLKLKRGEMRLGTSKTKIAEAVFKDHRNWIKHNFGEDFNTAELLDNETKRRLGGSPATLRKLKF